MPITIHAHTGRPAAFWCIGSLSLRSSSQAGGETHDPTSCICGGHAWPPFTGKVRIVRERRCCPAQSQTDQVFHTDVAQSITCPEHAGTSTLHESEANRGGQVGPFRGWTMTVRVLVVVPAQAAEHCDHTDHNETEHCTAGPVQGPRSHESVFSSGGHTSPPSTAL